LAANKKIEPSNKQIVALCLMVIIFLIAIIVAVYVDTTKDIIF